MIAAIVPACVTVAVAGQTDVLVDELFDIERRTIATSVSGRQREFETGRACARAALGRLGFTRCAIGVGDRGQPLWPDGVVGSITHCDGYRACAVARRADVAAVGIDAEPHAPLSERVTAGIATAGERSWLEAAGAPGLHLDRVLFSVKEAVFKTWFPYAHRLLGFDDCDVVLDASSKRFTARLTAPWPVVDGIERAQLDGRWRVQDGLVVAAVVVRAAGTAAYAETDTARCNDAPPSSPASCSAASIPERKHESIATPLR